jgi:DNA-binding FadR family transcriptional regulator
MIYEPISSPEIRVFALGIGDGPIRGASHIAWLLESAALECGWPADVSVGSESDLLTRFAASRDAVRGAIRILEARGSMRMHRGCQGGLRLQTPSTTSAATALAIYLRSRGYPIAHFEKAADVILPLLERSRAGRALTEMIELAASLLSQDGALSPGTSTRAEAFAMQLIDRIGAPLPERGIRVGNAADLCNEFGLGPRTFRQALNILEDLEILQVSLGEAAATFSNRQVPWVSYAAYLCCLPPAG